MRLDCSRSVGGDAMRELRVVAALRIQQAQTEDLLDEAAISLTHAIPEATGNAGAIPVSPPPFIDLLPIAVYACEASGRLRWFNQRAAELWGRSPRVGDDTERFCGSYKLYGLDGKLIRREETPMAHALRTGNPIDGADTAVER